MSTVHSQNFLFNWFIRKTSWISSNRLWTQHIFLWLIGAQQISARIAFGPVARGAVWLSHFGLFAFFSETMRANDLTILNKIKCSTDLLQNSFRYFVWFSNYKLLKVCNFGKQNLCLTYVALFYFNNAPKKMNAGYTFVEH